MAPNQLPPPLDGTDTTEQPETPAYSRVHLEDTMESLTRITLAGFGGSIVGLAQQRQQQQQQQSVSPRTDSSTIRKRPPTAASIISQKNNLGNQPRTWALSCMIFALILETSRRSSPTTVLLDSIRSTRRSDKDDDSWNGRVQDTAMKAVGDYTIGGTLAGLVGALAGWTEKARTTLSARAMQVPSNILASKAGRRPFIIWGLGAGMSLGLVAGVFQAGIDVGNMYLQDEQEQERLRRSRGQQQQQPGLEERKN